MMNSRTSLAVSTLVAAVLSTAGCGRDVQGHDSSADARLSADAARSALLELADLPGEWMPAEVPEQDRRSIAQEPGGSSCARSTKDLARVADAWAAAQINAETAYVKADANGHVLLREEVASDPDLDPKHLRRPLLAQAKACSEVRSARDAMEVRASLRLCPIARGGNGVQLVQAWSTEDGRSGTSWFAYLFIGRVLVVVSLRAAGHGNSCRDTEFDAIVLAAARKLSASLS